MRDEAEILGRFHQQVLRTFEESIANSKTPRWGDEWNVEYPYAFEVTVQSRLDGSSDTIRVLREFYMIVPEQLIQQVEQVFEDARINEAQLARYKQIHSASIEYTRTLGDCLGSALGGLESEQDALSAKTRKFNAESAIKEIQQIAKAPIASGEDLAERLEQLETVKEDFLYTAEEPLPRGFFGGWSKGK